MNPDPCSKLYTSLAGQSALEGTPLVCSGFASLPESASWGSLCAQSGLSPPLRPQPPAASPDPPEHPAICSSGLLSCAPALLEQSSESPWSLGSDGRLSGPIQ